MSGAVEKRRRDPDAKREAVDTAALALFSARGFNAVSIADIAARAGVAVGTVYRFYANKNALLRALHGRLEQRFVERMREVWNVERPHAERFEPLCHGLFDLIEAERATLGILAMTTDIAFEDGTLPGDAVRAEIAAMMEEGVAAGAFRREDPALLAAIAHGAVDGAMRRWLRHPTPERKSETLAVLPLMLRAAVSD